MQKEIERIMGFIRECAPDGVVLGVSGGLDSAVVEELCIRALGKDKVKTLFLPYGPGGGGGDHEEINISKAVEHANVIGTKDPVVLGNIMARIRMIILYQHANDNYLRVVGTTNYSEWMTGYFTKHGDGAADFEPILHLYKTQISLMAKELGISDEIISREPSADLWEGQTDQKEMGISYPDLDTQLRGLRGGMVTEMIECSEHKRVGAPSLLPGSDPKEILFQKIREGHFTDVYFNNTVDILHHDDHHPLVVKQFFNKTGGVVCGLNEAIDILKRCTKDSTKTLIINALKDGDTFKPFETVMTIEADLSIFAHLETVLLGIISRGTRIATNTNRVVEAAGGKPIMFFAARFDRYENQVPDGYAALVGGAASVSTPAQAELWDDDPSGTMPHSLLAAYKGDAALATHKFIETFPEKDAIALVDFRNDCVGDALGVAIGMKDRGYILDGVRLDTGGMMVDRSIVPKMGIFEPTGVCPELVHNVRNKLDSYGFKHIKIYVSGGFNVEKIKLFNELQVPIDGFGVGSSMFAGNYDFTADVVKPIAKTGREFNPNDRLELIE